MEESDELAEKAKKELDNGGLTTDVQALNGIGYAILTLAAVIKEAFKKEK